MAGFYALADSDAPVRTDLDNELEGERWRTTTRGSLLILYDVQMRNGSLARRYWLS